MKTSVVVLTLVFVAALSSVANADFIRAMATPPGVFPERCDAVLPPGVPVTIYIVDQTPSSAGCEWRVNNPEEVGILSVSSQFPYTGDPFTGIKFTYPTCQSGTFVVCELTLINLGLQHCSLLRIWGPPGYSAPRFTDCNGFTQFGWTWEFFYSVPTDICPLPAPGSCAIPLATESSTWGAVKAMYR